MAGVATIARDPETGGIALMGGRFMLLRGPDATAQNIESALLTLAGTWFADQVNVGTRFDMILMSEGTEIGGAIDIIRDVLSRVDGVSSVIRVARPQIRVLEGGQKALVFEDNSDPKNPQAGIEILDESGEGRVLNPEVVF